MSEYQYPEMKEIYPHYKECEEFAEILKIGEIGSSTSCWGFCPFCGDYI